MLLYRFYEPDSKVDFKATRGSPMNILVRRFDRRSQRDTMNIYDAMTRACASHGIEPQIRRKINTA